MIQHGYGPQNTADRVLAINGDEVAIWVTDNGGTTVMVANREVERT